MANTRLRKTMIVALQPLAASTLLSVIVVLPAAAQTTTAVTPPTTGNVPRATVAPQANPPIVSDTSGSAAAISVNSRARPGYEPLGIDIGSFLLLPSATLSSGYDDNLYASSRLKVADAFVVDSPRIVARSQWARHQLTVAADATIRRYFSNSIANSEQYGVNAGGVLDISRDSKLTVTSEIARKVEPRGFEGDTFIGSEPIGYREISNTATLSQSLGLLRLEGGVGYSTFNYGDTLVNGQNVDLSFRDFNTFTVNGRIGYVVSPSFTPFVSASFNRSTYPNSPLLVDRNSHGYQLLGGVSFDITTLITGQVGIGYIEQSFANPMFAGVSGLSYRASVVWNPTTLTTVTIKADRSLQRGPVLGVAGIVLSNIQIAVDHELLRNLVVHGEVTYANGSYRGIARSDHRTGGSLSARYYLNRNFAVSLTDSYLRQRPSADTAFGRSYDRNQILAGLTVQL